MIRFPGTVIGDENTQFVSLPFASTIEPVSVRTTTKLWVGFRGGCSSRLHSGPILLKERESAILRPHDVATVDRDGVYYLSLSQCAHMIAGLAGQPRRMFSGCLEYARLRLRETGRQAKRKSTLDTKSRVQDKKKSFAVHRARFSPQSCSQINPLQCFRPQDCSNTTATNSERRTVCPAQRTTSLDSLI